MAGCDPNYMVACENLRIEQERNDILREQNQPRVVYTRPAQTIRSEPEYFICNYTKYDDEDSYTGAVGRGKVEFSKNEKIALITRGHKEDYDCEVIFVHNRGPPTRTKKTRMSEGEVLELNYKPGELAPGEWEVTFVINGERKSIQKFYVKE